MIKKTLYPKTTRIGTSSVNIQITEKLDGSNLGFYVLPTSEGEKKELYVAQRNYIFTLTEAFNNEEIQGHFYKGLKAFLEIHGEELKESIYPGSVIFGEWIGMGKISYQNTKPYYMFAKARYDGKTLSKLVYEVDLLHYAFLDQVIPVFMDIVPVITRLSHYPTVEHLDKIYDDYILQVDRRVEGFVVHYKGEVEKYVRFKNGRMTPHKS